MSDKELGNEINVEDQDSDLVATGEIIYSTSITASTYNNNALSIIPYEISAERAEMIAQGDVLSIEAGEGSATNTLIQDANTDVGNLNAAANGLKVNAATIANNGGDYAANFTNE